MLIALFVAAVALLLIWNYARLSGFGRDYKFDGAFQGRQHECLLGGLDSESHVLCMLGADSSGLYLLPHPRKQGLFFRSGYRVFKKSLLIPWQDMECRTGRVLLKDCIWFRLEARKVYLYVPRDIGLALLSDAGRQLLG